MSGANENTPLVVGGGANDSLEQYLQRILNCRIESRLLPATSQASSVQVEGNLPPAALLDGIPGPGECDIEPLKWDEEVRSFYQEVIQNLIKAGSPVATTNDDPGTHPWPRVAAAFIGDFKWKEKVLLSILLLFGVALIGAEIFFLRNNVRRTSLTHPWEWPDYTLLSLRVSTTAWTIGSAAFIFLAGKRYMRPKRRRYLSLALRNNTIALTAMGIYVVSTFLIVMVLGIHNNLPPSFVFAHAFCGSLAKGAVYLVIILIIGSFHGVLDEFTFQDYLVALYPAIQPDDLAKLKHRVDSQRALYARGFWFAAFFGIVLFCGGETYLACNFRSVYDDLSLKLVESVAGSSTGQVAPQGTLDAVNLFLTLEAFPAASILTLVAIGLWRMNSQGNKWHDMSQAQKDAKLEARLIDAAKKHARRKAKLQAEAAAAAAAAMEEGRAPAILVRVPGDSVGSSRSRQT